MGLLKRQKANGGLEAAMNVQTELVAKHISKDGKELGVRRVKNKKVTEAFVAHLVEVLKGTTASVDTVVDYKWHAQGISTAAESSAHTALQSETTRRGAGTQIQVSSNQYRSVQTTTFVAARAITEHGLLTASAAGTLMDRTLFAVINAGAGDKIEYTFTITFNAGG